MFGCRSLDRWTGTPQSPRVLNPDESPTNPLELDRETMRAMGYAVVDRLIERITTLANDAAWRGAPRAELEPRLSEPAPVAPGDFNALLDRLYSDVLPFTARVDHPRFLAFVPGCPTWPGILGDFIAAGHNIFQGTWLGSSGPSALELVVLDWFKQWVGYPPGAAGLLLSGGSVANLTALACARAQLSAEDLARAVVYFSAESHSSVAKAARVLGFPAEHVRAIPADELGRLDVGPLVAAVENDRATGLLPLAVVASAGTTSTGAIDPLNALADFAAAEKLWLHVDGAYGGFAVLTERGHALLRGMERADSITLDPHKWLYQPFEVGCLLVREGVRLERAFHVMPHYLQDTAVSGREVNFGERGVQLTRSARVLKIWLSLQYFGVPAFAQAIERCLGLTLYAQERLEQSRRFELLSPASLGIVCFRRVWSGVDESEIERRNVQLTLEFKASGVGLISSTRANGRYALRLCILNHRTARSDVDRVIDWLENRDTVE